MKKLLCCLTSIVLLFVCLFAFTGCKKEENVLKLGFDADFYPFGFVDEKTGNYTGFDIEFAEMVCKEIGYKLELVPINWDLKDAELSSGAIDCIWNGFTINGRENDYEWSDAYCDNSIVILTKNNSGITKLSDLSNKNVMVQMASSAQTALDENAELVNSFKGSKYSMIANYQVGFQELEQGSTDALAIDYSMANYLLSNKNGFTILSEAICSEKYGVGFKKGNTELCKLINEAMNKVSKTNEFKTLCEKYDLTNSIIMGK